MNKLLDHVHLPVVTDSDGAAEIIGVEVHAIPILVSDGEIRPLGVPARNARRFFLVSELFALRDDRKKMDRIIRAIYRHWQKRNCTRQEIPSKLQHRQL